MKMCNFYLWLDSKLFGLDEILIIYRIEIFYYVKLLVYICSLFISVEVIFSGYF